MRTSFMLLVVLTSQASAGSGPCALTHNDGAEITFQHFTGIDPRPLPIGHAQIAEAVFGGKNPSWVKWSKEHLACPPGACSCAVK